MIANGQRGPHQGSSPSLHEEGMRCRLEVIWETAGKVVGQWASWGTRLTGSLLEKHTAQSHESTRGKPLPWLLKGGLEVGSQPRLTRGPWFPISPATYSSQLTEPRWWSPQHKASTLIQEHPSSLRALLLVPGNIMKTAGDWQMV